MYCRRSTAHCPQAVRRCIEGGPLPTAPRQWGSVMQELHCPLPPGSGAVHCRSFTAHCPLPTTTVQQGTHRAVWCRAPSRVHHTEGTGGAARHAGCSGQMRPCVTARRRRHGSVGQVRECTGPAMPQHTYTQRAHNTHSPARLPVPVGRHPGLCLSVTAPSAHHITSHHITSQHSTAQNRTAQHSTAQHSTAQHSTAQHSTAQNRTAQHSTAQHSTAQHRIEQHSTAQHSTSHHITPQHSTAQNRTAQHSTAQHNKTQHNTTQHNTTQHNTTQHNTTQLRLRIGGDGCRHGLE